ncbi:VirD4-like conjugal transfer protein, CD1115 family [Arcanobacterium haemolyticum]
MTSAHIVFIFILAFGGFWAGDKISYQIRTDLDAGYEIAQVLDRFWLDLNYPFHLSLEKVDLLAGLGTVAFIGLIWAYNSVGKGTRRQGEEHGSAAWARPSQIHPFKDKKRSNNILFTASESLSLDSRKTQRNLNALVIGSSGSGKSRYFVLPNLHQANTSFVVTDPKGELAAQTTPYLEQQGYKVRCLNLIDPGLSCTYNPLAYFNDAQPEVDVMIMTENFITNTTGKKNAGGDFWEKAERALLNALISYIYFTKGKEGTLIDVVDLLAKMQASESNEELKSDVDYIFDAITETINEYDNDNEQDQWGQEAVDALNGLRFAASQYNTYTQGAGETKKSVIISLGVRMAPLHMAPIRKLLATDTIEFDRVGQEKTALFLIIPDTHAAFTFLVSIFYEQFFEKSIYIADHTPERRLPYLVQCFMDEFANIGKMPSFERKIAVMRSRGISTSIIIQNFSQGKALYKDDWETIVGNCDSLLFLGGNEKSTTEYISKLVGKQTLASTDTSESKGRNGSWTLQNRTLGRDLITPDEVGRMDGRKCIYVLRGLPPFFSQKLPAPTM